MMSTALGKRFNASLVTLRKSSITIPMHSSWLAVLSVSSVRNARKHSVSSASWRAGDRYALREAVLLGVLPHTISVMPEAAVAALFMVLTTFPNDTLVIPRGSCERDRVMFNLINSTWSCAYGYGRGFVAFMMFFALDKWTAYGISCRSRCC